jgi:hypothetical protein
MSTNSKIAARGIIPPAPRGPRPANAPRAATHADRRTRRQRDRGARERAAMRDQH